MRRSWYLASILVLFFGLAAAGQDRADATLAVFLAIAPLVPVMGVGLAYGPGLDPAPEMTVATPLSGFRLQHPNNAKARISIDGKERTAPANGEWQSP